MLEKILGGNLFVFLLIFVRIGTMIFLMPGLGDTTVPTRMRLLFGLGMSLVLMPVLAPRLPVEPPPDLGNFFLLIFSEILIGVFFGTLVKMLMSTLEVAGTMISLSMGLSNAFLFNPQLGAQGSLPGAMLTTAGLALIFTTDFHHQILTAMADTYWVFTPGQSIPFGDLSNTIAQQLAQSFRIGVQLSAPFIILSTLFFVALGILGRLMPQLQIFFLAMPIQQYAGILLVMMSLSAILMTWMGYFDTQLHVLLRQTN